MKQTLEFASHPANLSIVRDFVRKFLELFAFSELERDLIVLGALIEKISGINYQDYIKQSFIKPLSLSNTCFVVASNPVVRPATSPLSVGAACLIGSLSLRQHA